jgi:hypothetical protein
MFVAIVLLLAMTIGGFTASLTTAQEATPAAGKDNLFADTLGLPELAITATTDTFEGVPAETAAGRYVVTLTAAPDVEFGAGVEFLMLPEDVTFDDFMAMFAGPPADTAGAAEGTPASEPMASPVAGGGEPGLPEWYYQPTWLGALPLMPGFTSQVILDLRPGTYVTWAGDPFSLQAPVELRVTGEAATPTAAEEPAAGATLTMFEYGFTFDGQLMPGQQVLKVTNVGAQPHFTVLVHPTEPVTKEQVGMLLEAEMAGTPPADVAAAAGVSNPDEWGFAAYAGTLSMGGVEWIPVDLEPGTYVLVCFVPEIGSGIPHAYQGMYDVITVGDGATPTANAGVEASTGRTGIRRLVLLEAPHPTVTLAGITFQAEGGVAVATVSCDCGSRGGTPINFQV